ncbi:MAG: class I SAM-dependent methyltransferase [archaeon]|nr:class I SAM-dependent methyltransferase [archaeon]
MQKKRPFNVFEFGSGTTPRGLFVKAVKSLRKGAQHRRFKGVEKAGFEKEQELRKLTREMGNVEIIHGNGLEELERTKDGSLDVLFEAHSSHYGDGLDILRLLNHAKQKLRPGGIFVSVQERSAWELYSELAQQTGLKFIVREIPEEIAKNSDSWAIRQRATHEQRVERRKKWETETPEQLQQLARLNFELDWWRDERFEDMFKPTMFIFKKPRN